MLQLWGVDPVSSFSNYLSCFGEDFLWREWCYYNAQSPCHDKFKAWMNWSTGLPPAWWVCTSVESWLLKVGSHIQHHIFWQIPYCSVSTCAFFKEPPKSRRLWLLLFVPSCLFFFLAVELTGWILLLLLLQFLSEERHPPLIYWMWRLMGDILLGGSQQ